MTVDRYYQKDLVKLKSATVYYNMAKLLFSFTQEGCLAVLIVLFNVIVQNQREKTTNKTLLFHSE